MQIDLQTYDEQRQLSFRSLKRTGNSFSGIVRIQSGGFSAERPIYFELHNIQSFCDQLESLDRLNPGTAKLRGDYEDDYLEFELLSNGHVHVTGELVEHSELGQHLEFGFQTDQTCIRPFLRDLHKLL